MARKVMNVYDVDEPNCNDNLNQLYTLVRERVLTGEPIQSSESGLFTGSIYSGHRGEHYGWQMFAVKDCHVLVEYWDGWDGFSQGISKPEPQDASLSRLRFSIHPPRSDIKMGIEMVVRECGEKYSKSHSRT
jgi:hypothetical protein